MAGIRSIGWYVPAERESAAELAREHGWSEANLKAFGLHSRTKPSAEDHPSTMGARATRAALEAAGLTPADVDLLVFAGMTRDHPAPWVAAFAVLAEIGATRAAGFDLASRCAGGHDAMWIAAQLVEANAHRNVVVCCADRFDYLFRGRKVTQAGDLTYAAGAAAVVLSKDAANEIVAFSHLTNEDLSLHRSSIPLAGGSRRPATSEPPPSEHLWHSNPTMAEVARLQAFLKRADEHNIGSVMKKAGFDALDYIATSPLDVRAQLAALRALGIETEHLVFSLPLLGHLGPADSLLGVALPLALGRAVGPRLVLSTRTLLYANAIAVRGEDPSLGIRVAGEGIDLTTFRAS